MPFLYNIPNDGKKNSKYKIQNFEQEKIIGPRKAIFIKIFAILDVWAKLSFSLKITVWVFGSLLYVCSFLSCFQKFIFFLSLIIFVHGYVLCMHSIIIIQRIFTSFFLFENKNFFNHLTKCKNKHTKKSLNFVFFWIFFHQLKKNIFWKPSTMYQCCLRLNWQ